MTNLGREREREREYVFSLFLFISTLPISSLSLIHVNKYQCYDKYLKEDYEDNANDKQKQKVDLSDEKEFGNYNSKPGKTNFFKKNGTYTTETGKFFLEWYSNKLILHGDQVLREANKIFNGLKIDLVAKVLQKHQYQRLVRMTYIPHSVFFFCHHSLGLLIPYIGFRSSLVLQPSQPRRRTNCRILQP